MPEKNRLHKGRGQKRGHMKKTGCKLSCKEKHTCQQLKNA
ncbi:hypothetical protein B4099_1052 [Heyndrickxia coagulans]|uniref:Uncharacterized protein n=1 Tax=Heyndrickxia coagulans TaxID=1398 RepID=A0A150KFG2_HEYCO|nr:hypothetical protein B4099_1052 [Heyndrickxia coagulans]